jgi:hypothetical protein
MTGSNSLKPSGRSAFIVLEVGVYDQQQIVQIPIQPTRLGIAILQDNVPVRVAGFDHSIAI